MTATVHSIESNYVRETFALAKECSCLACGAARAKQYRTAALMFEQRDKTLIMGKMMALHDGMNAAIRSLTREGGDGEETEHVARGVRPQLSVIQGGLTPTPA